MDGQCKNNCNNCDSTDDTSSSTNNTTTEAKNGNDGEERTSLFKVIMSCMTELNERDHFYQFPMSYSYQ